MKLTISINMDGDPLQDEPIVELRSILAALLRALQADPSRRRSSYPLYDMDAEQVGEAVFSD